MVKSKETTHFDKVLNVAEKSVEAWSNAQNKIEELSKSIDRLILEFKDLDNKIREKPCITETVQHIQQETEIIGHSKEIKTQQNIILDKLKIMEKATQTDNNVTLWLKFTVGIVVLVGTVTGALLAIFK